MYIQLTIQLKKDSNWPVTPAGRIRNKEPLVGVMKGMASTRHPLHPTRFVTRSLRLGVRVAWDATPLYKDTIVIKQSIDFTNQNLAPGSARAPEVYQSPSGSLSSPEVNTHRLLSISA